MIHFHEVIKAAKAGASFEELVEIAGSEKALDSILFHVRKDRVEHYRRRDLESPVWTFTYGALLKQALAELDALEAAYAKRK